jgi:hypothetical protein
MCTDITPSASVEQQEPQTGPMPKAALEEREKQAKATTNPASPLPEDTCIQKQERTHAANITPRTLLSRVPFAMWIVFGLSLIGLFLSMIQFVAPTFAFPVPVLAVWYFIEVIFGVIILAHIFVYLWEGIRSVQVETFFTFLLVVFGGITFLYATVTGITVLEHKLIVPYSVIAALVLAFVAIVDAFSSFRRP